MQDDSNTVSVVDPAPRLFRLHATESSVDSGQPSLLAISETLLMMCFYAISAYHFGIIHIAVAGLLAPFLLLATPESTELAVRWCSKYDLYSETGSLWNRPQEETQPQAGTIVSHLAIAIGAYIMPALLFKVAATTVTLLRQPLKSLAAIPTNWYKIVACLDFFIEPELVVGARARGLPLLTPSRFNKWYASMKDRWWYDGEDVVFRYVLVPLNYLVGCTYRLSIKGTALLFAPLIWVVRSSFRRRPQDIRDRAVYTFARSYSAAVMLFLAAKALHVFGSANIEFLQSYSDLITRLAGNQLFGALLQPNSFPPWHLALGFNAALAFLIYWHADYMTVYPNETWRDPVLRVSLLCRGIVTVYVLISSLTITLLIAHWPIFGQRVLVRLAAVLHVP